MRIGLQKGLKAVGKTSSWKTPLGGESMIRNPNCSLVLGAYCFSPPPPSEDGLTDVSGLSTKSFSLFDGMARCSQR